MTRQLPNIRYVALGPVAAGTIWWTFGGQLNLTLCAKASFALQRNQDMTLLEPVPIRREELKRLPSLSVLAPMDVVPQLPCPEITLVGHAHNAAGTGRSRVRLAVTRDGDTLIDKRLDVVGDRVPGGEPAPFTKLRLSYEHALGGIGYADNPLGRGKGAADDVAPNLIHPDDPEETVASFAPIPSAFAARRRRLAKLSMKALAAEVVAIPDVFDWSYFQSAPDDQRLDRITGEEWIWLEGMLAQHAHFRSRLPAVHVAARAYGTGGVPDFIPLRAESLHVDADEGVASLVWRGSFPVAVDAPSLLIAVGLSIGREPITWPATSEELAAWKSYDASSTGGASSDVTNQTLSITNRIEKGFTTTHDATPTGHATLPFDVANGGSGRVTDGEALPIPGAPWSPEKGREVPAPSKVSRTLLTDDNCEEQAALQAEIARRMDEADEKNEAQARAAAARARAAEEAERRRLADAAKFEREQREAATEAARRAAADAANKKRDAEQLLDDLYGSFKR